MGENIKINESNLKKINRFNLSNKVYKSKKHNEENHPDKVYKQTYGLKVSDDVKKVLGSSGVKNIGRELFTDENKNKNGQGVISINDSTVSTGGGDPLPKGSFDNEFLVAENAEEAEEMRERTDGEIPVRTLQYRDSKGQFSDGVDKVQKKLKAKSGDDSREYFKNKSGLTDEEFEERIKSLGITKDDFVYECLNGIDSVSRGLVDKKALLHHLRRNEGLTHKQALRIYDDRKYGRKDDTFSKRFSDEQNEKGNIKIYQTINENRAKANNRSNIMKKAWRKKHQSDAMKERISQNQKIGQQENQSEDNYKKVLSEVNPDLKGYSQDEIAAAKERIQAAHLYNPDVIKAEDVNNTALIKSEIDKARAKKGGQ